jgi:hypothetical protein
MNITTPPGFSFVGYNYPVNDTNVSAPGGTITTGGTGISTVQTWTYPAPNRSSQCPHCTPRCPHGYPADQIARPHFVPYWSIVNPVDGSGDGPHFTVRMKDEEFTNSNVPWTFVANSKDQS